MKRFHSGPATDPHMILLRVVQGGDEGEARRILAETEAGGATFTYGNHRFDGQYLKTELSRDYNRQGCAELAQALAAFIALPIE